MKKLKKDGSAKDKPAQKAAVTRVPIDFVPDAVLSKIEFDAQIDLESKIMFELNQPSKEKEEPSENTDSNTDVDVDTDPFCGL